MKTTNRADRANQIVANLRAAGLGSCARDDHAWHTVFVDDPLTGASCGTVQVFDSGAAKARVTYYADRVATAIGN